MNKVVQHRRLAALAATLLVSVCLAAGLAALAHADDDEPEVQVRTQPIGPYLVSVFGGGDSLTIGQALITIVVTDTNGNAVPDMNVDVETRGPGPRGSQHYAATHDNAVNEQTYAAFVDLPQPGRWPLTVHIAGAGDASFHLDVDQPRGYRHDTPDAPSLGSIRLRLTPAGSTPGLIVSDNGQARLLIPAGALIGSAGPERVEVFLRREGPSSPPGVALQGNVYRVDAISLANGEPVAEPWSGPAQLTLRVPAGATASGLFRLEDGAAVPVTGSVVSDMCPCAGGTVVEAPIDRGGVYVIGDTGP